MSEFTIQFRGKRLDVESLVQSLSAIEDIESAKIESVDSIPKSVLGRDPLNQFELVDVLVSFSVSLAARLTYDGIKHVLRDSAAENGFIAKDIEKSDDTSTIEKNDPKHEVRDQAKQ